jgi:hypothetical protein
VLLRLVDRNERRAKEHSRQIVDLVLILDPHLRRVDVNGDQMAAWYRRSTFVTDETSVLASKPLLLFKKEGPIVFTKKYVKHTLFSKKEYKPGTEGMIVNWHTGPLGGVTHVNIRLEDGEFVNNVPVEYFRAA